MKRQPINFAIPSNNISFCELIMHLAPELMLITTERMIGIISPASQYSGKRYPEIIKQGTDFRRSGQFICYF